MDDLKIECAVEAILFGAGDAVPADEIAEALEITLDQAEKVISALAKKYDDEKRGIKIIRLEQAYQMCSREDYYDVIRTITEPRRQQALSSSALETLSIIAYNQPITRSRIELIRGVDSSYSVARLLERGYIDEAGRLEAPGRPILYVTTEEFLRCFGLSSLSDLPEPEDFAKE